MSILHTVNKSPFGHNTLKQCLEVIGKPHCLVLIEDGVYGALPSMPCAATLSTLQEQGLNVYALTDDVAARGLNASLGNSIQLIDYSEFVELCCQHSTTQSWY